MRALVVGVGAVGTRAGRQLVDTTGVTKVLLADEDTNKVAQVANAFGDKAEVVSFSPGDPIPEGVDVVACALPSGFDHAVITAAISPYRDTRDANRALIEGDGSAFIEVHVAATLDECEARDVKGLYAEARAGRRPGMTGIDDPYEPPANPEVTLATGSEPLEASLGRLLSYLEARGLAPALSVAGGAQ